MKTRTIHRLATTTLAALLPLTVSLSGGCTASREHSIVEASPLIPPANAATLDVAAAGWRDSPRRDSLEH